MATTNLLTWNPTAVGQETDAEYLADSQRAGGATDPSLFDAALANKAFYQWSTYLTALFQAFANKGFTTSDSNLNTLTAQCANFLTTADTLPPIQSVAYSPTPTFNAGAASGFQMTLTGNITGITITGAAPGELIAIEFIQDGAGGRTVNGWPTLVTNTAAIPQPDLSPGSGTLYLFRVELNGNIHPAAPAISANGTYVTNLNAADTVTGGALVVTGNATVTGNTQTNTLTSSNGATITGTINTNQVNVTGSISATGGITTSSAQVNGNETVTGTTTTGALSVTGSGTVTSNLLVGSRLTAGSLTLSSPGSGGQVLTNVGGVFVPEAVPRAQGVVNVVTGSRTNNTTYQNTSGGIMLVSGAFFTDAGGGNVGNIGVLIGLSSPTTVVFANQATATENSGDAGFYGAVPNGWFYSVNISSGVTGPVHYWVETIIS